MRYVYTLYHFHVFKLFKTDGGSMEPSIKDGQYVLVNKIYYKINDHERFDVVILYDFENICK